jgi:DNA-binding MarR family transcriptional regulator
MSLLFDLWLVNHLISGALDEVLATESGLSGEDFGFYSLLRRFGPATPTQVSRWTAMPPTTVSATVRRLIARGHVDQRRNPADGRSRLIALTDAGVHAHTQAAEVFFAATRTLAAAIGADEPRQRAALQRLDRALREVSRLDPRPYTVKDAPGDGEHHLHYLGAALMPDEEDTVRAYIDFVRSQRTVRTSR